MSDYDYNRVVAHMREGNKIEAIKVVRGAAYCGLREAKDAVEWLGYELNMNGYDCPSSTTAKLERKGFFISKVQGSISIQTHEGKSSATVEFDSSEVVSFSGYFSQSFKISIQDLKKLVEAVESFR
jgi:hypothetical protein